MTKIVFLLLCAFAVMSLQSCTKEEPIIRRTATLPKQRNAMFFGEWYIDHCNLVTRTTDMLIKTNGKEGNKGIRFSITTNKPLIIPPSLTINVMETSLPVEGKNTSYSFTLPYEAYTLAKMQQDYAYFIMTYQFKESREIRQHFFSTKALPKALAYLSRTCK